MLRGAAAGRLLLHIDGEVISRWRTAGHVFVPPMPAGEAGEEQVSETEMPLLSTVKNPAPQTARLLPAPEQVTEAALSTAEQVSTVPSSR